MTLLRLDHVASSIVNANHRIVRADEKLTAFLELESAIFGNWRDPVKRARQVAATPWFNHQGQAHIVSITIRSPRSYSGKVEAAPWFRTWFSVDPQPASINPTVNISIVFICAVLDCGRIIHHPAIKNDSSARLMLARSGR